MPVSSWSTTAASNTGILSGITLDGSIMTVPQVDNAFREMAAQIAAQLGKVGFEGADIASATTTNLANATGWSLDITGTTTITGFGTVDAGQMFMLRFTGALTLTHNATSLILPGAANITTAANDVAFMKSEGSGNWRCVGYQRASGTPIGYPTSSTDNTLPRFDGTAGKLQTSGIVVDDSNNVSSMGTLSAGAITSSGTVTAVTSFISTGNVVLATTGAGTVFLRPNGAASSTGQATIDSSGNLLVAGSVTGNLNFIGGGNVVLATTGAGTVFLRPNGSGSGTGQLTIASTGTVTITQNLEASSTLLALGPGASGTVLLQPNGLGSSTGQLSMTTTVATFDAAVAGDSFEAGTFSSSGASAGQKVGTTVNGGRFESSATSTGSYAHVTWHNPNSQVGNISTSGTATAYNTSSDENLKDFTGNYDPAEAIRIIRADPVRTFNWKADGTPAIGWGAQTSHKISADLATPGHGKPGDEDYQPWGVDQGKRTPYLWTAVANLLDRIEALEVAN